jgi:hypothetical protein
MMTNEEHHKIFLRRLESSRDAVWLVAYWLHRRGWTVEVPAIHHGEKRSDWKKFSDEGDLLISTPGSLTKHRVEVKGINYQFTCLADWPFKLQYLICTQHSFDKANPKPLMYVTVSPDGVHLGIVLSEKSPSWKVSEWADKEHPGIRTPRYWCDPINVRFMSINDVEVDLSRRVQGAHGQAAGQDEVPQQAAGD